MLKTDIWATMNTGKGGGIIDNQNILKIAFGNKLLGKLGDD